MLRILLLLLFSAYLMAEPNALSTYTIKNLTFQSPVSLTEPNKVGLDAFAFFGEQDFEIDMIFISKTMVETMEMDDAELLQYVKAIFLATYKPAITTETRYVLNQKVMVEMLNKNIPKPLILQVYLLNLPDESKLALAFIYTKDMVGVDEIIATVESSLEYK